MSTEDVSAIRERLERAGWSPHCAFRRDAGAWVASVSDGERVVLSTGATEAEAWRRVWRQAAALGLPDGAG
jgi:hypothetical protein